MKAESIAYILDMLRANFYDLATEEKARKEEAGAFDAFDHGEEAAKARKALGAACKDRLDAEIVLDDFSEHDFH